jgi:hypothetical protein
LKYWLLLMIAVCLLSPAAVLAQAKPYIGGCIGASFYDTELEDVKGDDFKLDGNEFAWKIFGGIRAARFWALEGGYVNFGKIQNTVVDTDLESHTTGWDLFAVLNLPLGPLDAFGKAGILWWRTDSKIEDDPFDVKGYDFTWGLGAAIRLGGVGIRAEFESFEMDGDDKLMTLTAGVAFGM